MAVLQLPTYLSEELSASALPMSHPLSLIRDSGPEPIQLMCTHNAPQIHPNLHPFTPSPFSPKNPFLQQQRFRRAQVIVENTGMIFSKFERSKLELVCPKKLPLHDVKMKKVLLKNNIYTIIIDSKRLHCYNKIITKYASLSELQEKNVFFHISHCA